MRADRASYQRRQLRSKQLSDADSRFDHHIEGAPAATYLLLTLLVAVYVWAGFAWRGRIPSWIRLAWPRPDALMLRFGARDGVKVDHGDWWRLLTHGFVHWNLLHLLLNGVALWGLGRICEPMFGPVRFFWIFLVSVLGGGLLSQTGPAGVTSAGASGGVFGLLGALLVFGWRRGGWLPPDLRELLREKLWPWVLVNLVLGFVLPFVDNRAHIGGLLAGALCGAVTADQVTWNNRPGTGATVALGLLDVIALTGTAIAIAVNVART